MHGALVLAVALVATAFVAGQAPAAPTAPTGSAPLDCANWRYSDADEPAPGTLPTEYDRGNWKRTSLRDLDLATSPHHLCGQKGAAVDLAWGVNQGDPNVRIAVLDSGIKWRDAGAMHDLADKAYVNLGEARPPCAATSPDGDCNGDGRLSITDFGAITDRNGNGLPDPEDLILDPAVANGRDDDRNGYVDDISGWDFLFGDNNPLDTVEYGHGTGEAEDSTAASNGQGDVGTCPQCTFIPVRVGDSFIADSGRFAAGVLFALDSGTDVVQEALGTINNPRQAQQAIDIAYERGVPVVASMADEASKHPNLPASLEHTLAVNSVRDTDSPKSYLALNGCTNWGGHTWVSVPSSSCSSEATGISAGIVGLLESEARAAGIPPHPDLRGAPGDNVLSANEAMQLVRNTADDIDFSTPNATDPANDFALGGSNERYPSRAGWDAVHGYGRINAYELTKAARDARIPPEADLTSPQWFDLLPASGRLRVSGRVAAVRADSYSARVEWAPGFNPPPYPGADEWRVVAQRDGLTREWDGRLASIDLASIAAALSDGGHGVPADPTTGRSDEERFSARVRVVVTAHGGPGDGLTAESQKQIFVHDDPDLRPGFPRRIAGVGTSSPVFVDLDRRSRGAELIVATDDGEIHALRADGREMKGWPVQSVEVSYWEDSPTDRVEDIDPPGGGFMVGAPAVADLDGDGRLDVAAADLEGNVYAWNARGRPLRGFRVVRDEGVLRSAVHTNPDYSRDDPAAQDSRNRTKRGIAGSLVAADLDGDRRPELIAAGLDRHVYAWHGDGKPVAGFPRQLIDPAKVDAIDPITHKVTFHADSGVGDGGELVATPAVGDLDGDGTPEIVVGAQEQYEEPLNVPEFGGLPGEGGNSRVYALDAQGDYLPGWPVKVAMLQSEVLPVIGNGVSAQAAIGDLVPSHPGREVAVASAAGPMYILGADGKSVHGQPGGKDKPLKWFGGLILNLPAGFGEHRNSNDIGLVVPAFSGPAAGRLGDATRPDVATSTSGLSRLLDAATEESQLPNDDLLMAWDTESGLARPGFPRETADLAFFVTPAIADVDGDGHNEVIAGNGVYTLTAVDADGRVPQGWPKLTGGWLVGTPALGDWDGDGRAELVVVRRDGVLLVWNTPTRSTALTEWPRFGRDLANTGALP